MTAAAAAEKKRQLQELFYKYNSARGLAGVNCQYGNYKKAVAYYTEAAEAAEKLDERLKLPLILARSVANCKVKNLAAAHEDIKTAKETAPENISVIENDAYALLARKDFEHALVQYTIGHEKRLKPDTCDTGVKVCRSIIKKCIGKTAGSFMATNNLGKAIIDMVTTKKKCVVGSYSSHEPLNAEQRRALYKKTRMKKEKILGQLYFPGMQNDKEFLQHCKVKLKGSKKASGKELVNAVNESLSVIENKQKALMAYYPMYAWAHNKPKLSIGRQKKVEEEKLRFLKGAMTVARRLIAELRAAFNEENDSQCFRLAFRTERYINYHCKMFITEKEVTEILESLYDVIGDLYFRMKKLQADMSSHDNDRRIYCMLGIEMPDTRFTRKIKSSLMPHVFNKRIHCRDAREKLEISVSGLERTFWCHELAACLSTTNNTEQAQKFAQQGYKYAKSIGNMKWIVNNAFLIARASFLYGDINEAREILTEIIKQAEFANRLNCKMFLKKVKNIMVSDASEQLIMIPPVKKRQKQIIDLMPNLEMKEHIVALFREVDSLPEKQRFRILPKTEVDTAKKKRHIRLRMATKRRTIIVMRDAYICHKKPISDARPTFVI